MINIRKLENELWESADLLRSGSNLTANEYCMPVMGLIFLRYAYSRFKVVETELMKNRPSRGGRVKPVEAADFVAKSALFLPREAQYEYLLNLPENVVALELKNSSGQQLNSLGEVVNYAMELVDGERRDKHAFRNLREIARVGLQAASAIAYAHLRRTGQMARGEATRLGVGRRDWTRMLGRFAMGCNGLLDGFPV